MANTIISPNRYVQGRGELKNLPEHAKKLGKKLFVIISLKLYKTSKSRRFYYYLMGSLLQ